LSKSRAPMGRRVTMRCVQHDCAPQVSSLGQDDEEYQLALAMSMSLQDAQGQAPAAVRPAAVRRVVSSNDPDPASTAHASISAPGTRACAADRPCARPGPGSHRAQARRGAARPRRVSCSPASSSPHLPPQGWSLLSRCSTTAKCGSFWAHTVC
jgi:hypothetical protein